jgi:hypothetical protein
MNPKLQTTIDLLTLAFALPASAQTWRSDLNGNGLVNGADLGILLSYWGLCNG